MSRSNPKNSHASQVLSIYWQHSKPYKKRLLIIYGTMIVAQVVEDFLQPLIVSYMLTRLAQGTLSQLQTSSVILILVGVALSEAVGHVLWNRLVVPMFWRVQDIIQRDLTMTAFRHLQKMSMQFFNDRFAGSLVNQVNKFVSSFERLTDALTWNVYKLIVSVIATTIILAPKAPLVSVAILGISIIYIYH